jgi:hypothetical protein
MNRKRRALIVGIDHYQQPGMDLKFAGADARAMESMLKRNQDGSANFECCLYVDKINDSAPIHSRGIET